LVNVESHWRHVWFFYDYWSYDWSWSSLLNKGDWSWLVSAWWEISTGLEISAALDSSSGYIDLLIKSFKMDITSYSSSDWTGFVASIWMIARS